MRFISTTNKPSFLEGELLAQTRFLRAREGAHMRKVKFIANNYYHLFNRGVNRETIFPDERNWSFFIRLIRRYFRQELIDVVAYCLMPNHYHILVQLKSDDLGMQIMQPFSVSYTKAINKEQGRVGPLFQGPFQAKHVADENHLSWLSRYIHLNPVEAGLVSEPQEWPYSSY
jgi:putative transposase